MDGVLMVLVLAVYALALFWLVNREPAAPKSGVRTKWSPDDHVIGIPTEAGGIEIFYVVPSPGEDQEDLEARLDGVATKSL